MVFNEVYFKIEHSAQLVAPSTFFDPNRIFQAAIFIATENFRTQNSKDKKSSIHKLTETENKFEKH